MRRPAFSQAPNGRGSERARAHANLQGLLKSQTSRCMAGKMYAGGIRPCCSGREAKFGFLAQSLCNLHLIPDCRVEPSFHFGTSFYFVSTILHVWPKLLFSINFCLLPYKMLRSIQASYQDKVSAGGQKLALNLYHQNLLLKITLAQKPELIQTTMYKVLLLEIIIHISVHKNLV